MGRARIKPGKLGTTSTELDKKYPFWRNQATSKGGHNTVSANSTIKSYQKIADWLLKNKPGAKILDASSGSGAGTELMRAKGLRCDDVEPFVSKDRKAPTYTDYNTIRQKYDVVISNAVINVIPDDWRANLIRQMASLVAKGGIMIINTRSEKEIKEIANAISLDCDSEKLLKKGKNSYAYQRGFTPESLAKYVNTILNGKFAIEKANVKNSGISTSCSIVCTKL